VAINLDLYRIPKLRAIWCCPKILHNNQSITKNGAVRALPHLMNPLQLYSISACNDLKLLEVVSKPQIRFKGKAQADRGSPAAGGMSHLKEACNTVIGP
jgi:hypothetical protein